MRQSFEAYRLGRGSTSLLGLLSWRGILALAIGTTLVVAVFLATAGLFLLLLPIAVLAAVIGRLLYGWKRPTPTRRKSAPMIEGSYEIVSDRAPAGGPAAPPRGRQNPWG